MPRLGFGEVLIHGKTACRTARKRGRSVDPGLCRSQNLWTKAFTNCGIKADGCFFSEGKGLNKKIKSFYLNYIEKYFLYAIIVSAS
jgi:hypothetical protein